MTEIIEYFHDKGISRGGIIFFKAADALMIIRKCKSMGEKILGIDGFILDKNYTQPVLEHSLDLSDYTLDDSFGQAEQFLQKYVQSKFYFEVVIDS